MTFSSNILSVKIQNALLIVVLCFNSVYILFDNLEFDSFEIVDVFDSESNSENEVKEKIEFEDEIVKMTSACNLASKQDKKSIELMEDGKIQNLSRKILIPPPRS